MSAIREDGKDRRSARELRESLAQNRERLDRDLSELGHRFQDFLNPRHLLGRHPILTAGAGAVLGFLIVRHPAHLLRAASRLAGLGAPLLLSALMKGDGEGPQTPSEPAARDDEP